MVWFALRTGTLLSKRGKHQTWIVRWLQFALFLSSSNNFNKKLFGASCLTYEDVINIQYASKLTQSLAQSTQSTSNNAAPSKATLSCYSRRNYDKSNSSFFGRGCKNTKLRRLFQTIHFINSGFEISAIPTLHLVSWQIIRRDKNVLRHHKLSNQFCWWTPTTK